jgi:hypothetical protein
MKRIKLPILPYRSEHIQSPEWQALTRGLTTDLDSGKVFCLSYEILATRTAAMPRHRYKAWRKVDGKPVAFSFGDENPEITRDYGSQLFSILNQSILQLTVHRHLFRMLNDRSGEGPDQFTVGFCPAGIFMFSNKLDQEHYVHGKGVVGAIVTAREISNHLSLRLENNLVNCLNTLIADVKPVLSDATGYATEIQTPP